MPSGTSIGLLAVIESGSTMSPLLDVLPVVDVLETLPAAPPCSVGLPPQPRSAITKGSQ
jgi:hypothetical protein